MITTQLSEQTEIVRKRIKEASELTGRTADQITLIAVSKTQSIAAIEAAYECGIRHFGENRSSELQEKAKALSHLKGIQWHFIGTLQSRQAHLVAGHAQVFHAVDRISIAKILSAELEKVSKSIGVFVQVNVSGEESKSGFDCSNWETDVQQQNTLSASMTEIMQFPNLELKGLMTMAPATATPEEIRTIFKRTKKLFEWVKTRFPNNDFNHLSMGMSGDFEIAIQEGATHVRVGSAIFKH